MIAAANMLLIPKIENGIVIDHIPAGWGLKILQISRNHAKLQDVVISLGENYKSKSMGKKDLIKFQVLELPPKFLHHLSLVCPGVTVKRIKDYAVDRKIVLEVPEIVNGLLKCPNPSCITNYEPGTSTSFHLLEKKEMNFRCNYCERHFHLKEFEGTYF